MIIDCFIGIDPGASGGIGIYKPNEVYKVLKMPKDVIELRPFLKNIKETSNNALVFIEKVSLRPDDMTENIGKAFRVQKMMSEFQRLKDVMEFEEIPFVQVHPMSWQSYLNLRKKGEDKKIRKNRYKMFAQENYPEVKATLWNSDATCLVHFGRKKYLNDKNWIIQNLPSKQQKLFQ